jgi:secondary thiamine-phosphate synthase enzyme
MRQAQDRILLATDGQGLYEITSRVRDWVGRQRITTGLLTLYLHHTSASLLIQENAWFRKAVPEDMRSYRHTQEGADDMPAHIRAALTAIQVSVPVADGHLDLGRWQGIFLYEHRARGHERRVTLHLVGE